MALYNLHKWHCLHNAKCAMHSLRYTCYVLNHTNRNFFDPISDPNLIFTQPKSQCPNSCCNKRNPPPNSPEFGQVKEAPPIKLHPLFGPGWFEAQRRLVQVQRGIHLLFLLLSNSQSQLKLVSLFSTGVTRQCTIGIVTMCAN